MPKFLNELVDFRQCHSVYCLRCRALGHCTFVGVQFRVGSQAQAWVVELSVDILDWKFSLAALAFRGVTLTTTISAPSPSHSREDGDPVFHRYNPSEHDVGSPFISLLDLIGHRLC
jgi:hypothetical protein